MKKVITMKMVEQYQNYLREEEKSQATIEKYTRDLKKLFDYMDGREITKSLMIDYKNSLLSGGEYQVSSINSYLVAANRYFEYLGWYEVRVKTLKIQKEAFCSEKKYLTKQEYKKLVRTAGKQKKRRIAMILQTICATGIRISELSFVTVSAVRKGSMEIRCKGKIRQVLFPTKLQTALLLYVKLEGIDHGVVFRTINGNPVNRSNVWKEMKALCKEAGVEEEKVFPHNLRHLFAQEFYEIKKDIAKLADVLGHSNIETTSYGLHPVFHNRFDLQMSYTHPSLPADISQRYHSL